MADLPLVLDLHVVTGETFTRELIWKDAAGEPVDLTGWSGELMYGFIEPPTFTPPGGQAITGTDGGVELGGTDGTITITIEKALTDTIANSSNGGDAGVQVWTGAEWPPFQYRLNLIDGDGKVTTYALGLLTVQKALAV